MTHEPLEYERSPIPEGVLLDADGEPVPLRGLAHERAVLMVFPGWAGDERDAALRTISAWRGRMPLVELVVVAKDPQVEHEELASCADRVLGDPRGTIQEMFGAKGHVVAVLLGTDGLLAGGPVAGDVGLASLVQGMAMSFQELYGESMRPPTGISCKCITYGRVEYLEESLESFLRQDYAGDHELVIVNDYPRQRLHFDHPRVRIYNLDFTFETIGEMENFAVSACRYDTIAVWDDDDIALPNHLRNIDRFISSSDLLHWQLGVAFVDGSIAALTSLGNSGIVYSKPKWREVGGHPFENAGYDVTFVNRLQAHGARVTLASPPPEEVSWFYNWGNGSYHMSGLGTDHEGRPNVVQRHSAHIEELREAGQIPAGDIELTPRWNRDYVALLADHVHPAGGPTSSGHAS